ncbi:MAG: hypothetical protein SGILL_002810, partial [Bacillariaceae sp.]
TMVVEGETAAPPPPQPTPTAALLVDDDVKQTPAATATTTNTDGTMPDVKVSAPVAVPVEEAVAPESKAEEPKEEEETKAAVAVPETVPPHVDNPLAQDAVESPPNEETGDDGNTTSAVPMKEEVNNESVKDRDNTAVEPTVESNDDNKDEENKGKDDTPPPPPPTNDDDDDDDATSSTTSPAAVTQSKGAQILMNRFSTWRMTANENAASLLSKTQANTALQENAKQAQEYAQRMKLRFLAAKSTTEASEENADDDDGGGEKVVTVATTTEESTDEPPKDAAGDAAVAASSSDGNDNKSNGGGRDGDFIERNESQESKSTYSSAGGGDASSSAMDDETYSEATSAEGTSTTTTTTTNTPYTRERMRAVLTRASMASTVVAESVATSFRGRYNTATDDGNEDSAQNQGPELTPTPESQVALILKSRAGEHMQEILNQLEDYEFAMLLGRGMLGVNLKQCYLKNHGVFVDYLVSGGQAEQSGLIRSGDLLVRLGETDFRKGTIKEVPHEIAKAKRPSVLVMSTGTQVPLERVNYVDVAVAMMHRARTYYKERGSLSNLPSASPMKATAPQSELGGNEQNAEALAQPEKEEKSDDPLPPPKSVCNVTIALHDSVESFVSPPWPNLEVRKEFIDEVSLRCRDKFVVSDLSQVLDMDTNFRAAIRNAFLVCALDSRRMPFLARHFAGEEFEGEGAEEGGTNSSMTPSAQLMLFLELASFLDLYEVTPVVRLRDTASRIAYKFFLPTKIGNRLQPPLFDFHHIAPDASLRHLEFVLSGKSQIIPRDLFLDFQRSVVDALVAAPFLSFLSSADCSRMRAYLRDTSPFINLPLKPMIEAISMKKGDSAVVATATSSSEGNLTGPAKNILAYNILYLICRMEKEGNGEYNFSFENEINRRLLGAPNDLCCCIFIKRTLLPELESAKAKTLESDSGKLVEVVERFWELYVADTLELSTKSTEIESTYGQVRTVLEAISTEVSANPSMGETAIVKLIVESKLMEEAQTLADELLYEYAANVHTKLRDHKFHEWMCNELSKVVSGDPNWWQKQTIPTLTNGCLKRLLRKVDFPVGISAHKPFKATPKEDSERQYHNADWAVVFGSCVGTELASQMPVPGLGSLDVRRYTCLPVSLDQDHDYDDFRPEEILPATFESYAVVPPSKLKPFKSLVDAGRVSVDGWEISLVTFTMPNGDSGSSGDAMESALYGVSLCFQRPSIDAEHDLPTATISTEIYHDDEQGESQDTTQFRSPITFEKTESEGETSSFLRKVQMGTDVPVFAGRLKEQAWTQRVAEDEHRDPSQPFVVGIALKCGVRDA